MRGGEGERRGRTFQETGVLVLGVVVRLWLYAVLCKGILCGGMGGDGREMAGVTHRQGGLRASPSGRAARGLGGRCL